MRESLRTRSFATALIAGLLILAVSLSALPVGLGSPFRTVAHADPKGIKYLGVGSCAGNGCHTQDIKPNKKADDKEVGHDESTIWERFDLHSRAAVDSVTRNKARALGLGSERAKGIVAKLNSTEAMTNKRCTVCHTLSGFSNGESKTRILLNPPTDVVAEDIEKGRFKEANGVSCDACHGPSSGYLVPHQTKGWTTTQRKALPGDKLFDQLGLYDTKNLKMRANLCVSCHLKIDPELIGAGHPEPLFELDSYCHGSWMHWRPLGNFDGTKVWAMGQFACVREAAIQLADRITAPTKLDPKLIHHSYQKLAAHVLMARHPATLVAPELLADFDTQYAAVDTNWKDPAASAKALHALGGVADALMEKLSKISIDKAMAETLANDVAAEGEAAGAKDFLSGYQYAYAMTSLWETNFLLGTAPELDRAELDKKIKDTPKSQKIRALQDEVDDAEKFNPDTYKKAAQELMAMFPGGKALPLPGKEPDDIAKLRKGGAAPATPPAEVKPPVAEAKPAAPVAEVKKPDAPAVTAKEPAKPEVKPAEVKPAEAKPAEVKPAETKPAATVAETKPATPPATVEKPNDPTVLAPSAPLDVKLLGKVIFCPRCGLKNTLDANFCLRCGLKLPKLSE